MYKNGRISWSEEYIWAKQQGDILLKLTVDTDRVEIFENFESNKYPEISSDLVSVNFHIGGQDPLWGAKPTELVYFFYFFSIYV